MRTALTSYVLTLAILIPMPAPGCATGWARARIRRAIMVFGVGSLLCGLAQTLPQLVAARVFQGLGGASLMPVGRYVLVRSIDQARIRQRHEYGGHVRPAWLGARALARRRAGAIHQRGG
jgi:MFS family permease